MGNNNNMSDTVCPLCEEIDKDEHILKYWDNFILIFNRYPYTPGHLMVIPRKHSNSLNDLTPIQRSELIEAINDTEQTLFKVLNISSTNIGVNHGVWSGASIPEHLHIHIVPRFPNDVGFYGLLYGKVPERNMEINRVIKQAYQTFLPE